MDTKMSHLYMWLRPYKCVDCYHDILARNTTRKLKYSQTSAARTRMARIPWMDQTNVKVLTIFPINLYKVNLSSSKTAISNSRTKSLTSWIIKSFNMPLKTQTLFLRVKSFQYPTRKIKGVNTWNSDVGI